jgi:putative NADH-flavin reductase
MKIAVVGATGATGRRVIKHALARGHLVTAVARHPERLSSADRLSFVRGDVLSPEGLTGALDGVEAVISCIGPEKNLSPGTLTTSEKPSSDIFSTHAPISRAVAYPSVMQDASKGHQRRLRSKR